MTRKPNIFVLDDHDAVLAAVAELLRTNGHAAECFTSPVDFLLRCVPRRPGCLVVDLAIPGIDGRRFLERVRTIHDRLSVVVVTHDALEGGESEWSTLGVTAMLRKPLEAAKFLAAVDAALAHSQAQYED